MDEEYALSRIRAVEKEKDDEILGLKNLINSLSEAVYVRYEILTHLAHKKKDVMEVYRPGSKVRFARAEELIEAHVLSANIRRDGVYYEVSWWNGRTRNVAEVTHSELTQQADDTRKIGFVPEQSKRQEDHYG